MFRKRAYGFLVALVGGALVLSACGVKPAAPAPSSTPSPAPSAPGAKKPTIGGVFTDRIPSDPDLLIPYFGKSAYGGSVWGQVMGAGGLLYINEKNEPEAYFAKSWKSSDDNLTWTFTLRDDVKFHDGKPLTADDVVFSYSIPMDKDYTGTSKSSFNVVKEVKALDPLTVQITLNEPFAPFLFTTVTSAIMPKHAVPAGTPVNDIQKLEFAKKPFGAGPYKFVEWKPGQYVELEANPDFFMAKEGKGPFVKTYRIKVIQETQTHMAALEAGEVDISSNTEPQFVERFKSEFKDKLKPYEWERNGFGYQTLNNEKWPTSDKVVRKAMSMALNKDAILKGPLDNKAKIPPGPIPPVSWAFDPNLKSTPFDPAAAKKMLDDAGYKPGPDGIRVKDGKRMVIDYYGSKGSALIEGIALQAKKDWTDLGMEVNVNFVDFNTLLANHMEPGNFHVTFSAFNLGVDPDSMYNIYHSSNAKKNDQGLVKGNNVARYINPDVDKLLEDARKTFDIAKRKQLYSQFVAKIIDDAPHIWIYANLYTDFVNAKVKGVVNRPGYGPSYLDRWWITEA